jgi:hypothetical protein
VAIELIYSLGLGREQAQMLIAESVDGAGRSKKRRAKAKAAA